MAYIFDLKVLHDCSPKGIGLSGPDRLSAVTVKVENNITVFLGLKSTINVKYSP